MGRLSAGTGARGVDIDFAATVAAIAGQEAMYSPSAHGRRGNESTTAKGVFLSTACGLSFPVNRDAVVCLPCPTSTGGYAYRPLPLRLYLSPLRL